MAVFVFWLSFGPAAGLYTLFFEIVPAFSLLRAPARFAVLAPLSLAVLMAVGLAPLFAKLRGAARILAPTALSTAMTLELAVVPLAMPAVPPIHEAYQFLAAARPGVVAEFPFFHARPDYPRHTSYMLLSTYHWMPLVNGYSDHIPEDFRRLAEPLSSFPTREAFAILRARHTRYVVFHLDMYDQVSRRRLLERIERYKGYLQPLSQTENVWLFEIVDWP